MKLPTESPTESIDRQSWSWLLRRRISKDRLAVLSLWVVLLFLALALGSWLGLFPSFQSAESTQSYVPPGSQFYFGSDLIGRSVILKIVHGAEIAMIMGIVVTLIAIPIGVLLGAVAGYFGGWIDEIVVWLYTTVASIPSILLLIAVSYVLGKGMLAVCIAIGTVSWVGTARLVRGEYLKHRGLDYVDAARAIGAGRLSILFRHILPNVMHIILIQISLQFVYAIKSEVILTFLGVGVNNKVSWGSMISDAQGELHQGIWWQFTAANVALMVIVFAFNYFSDVLRDALDPKLHHEA